MEGDLYWEETELWWWADEHVFGGQGLSEWKQADNPDATVCAEW